MQFRKDYYYFIILLLTVAQLWTILSLSVYAGMYDFSRELPSIYYEIVSNYLFFFFLKILFVFFYYSCNVTQTHSNDFPLLAGPLFLSATIYRKNCARNSTHIYLVPLYYYTHVDTRRIPVVVLGIFLYTQTCSWLFNSLPATIIMCTNMKRKTLLNYYGWRNFPTGLYTSWRCVFYGRKRTRKREIAFGFRAFLPSTL